VRGSDPSRSTILEDRNDNARGLSAALADHLGLAANFYIFAALNLAGALLVNFTVHRAPPMPAMGPLQPSSLATWALHLKNRPLRSGFGIGFCILFAFIGTFTYVNFVPTRAPLSLGSMQLGFVYFVFLPSILTTPLAGAAVQRIGTQRALWAGLATAGLSLPLLAAPSLLAVLVGMVLMGVGTFFARATATTSSGMSRTPQQITAMDPSIILLMATSLSSRLIHARIACRGSQRKCRPGIVSMWAANGGHMHSGKP
jgi:hypothetical protein